MFLLYFVIVFRRLLLVWFITGRKFTVVIDSFQITCLGLWNENRFTEEILLNVRLQIETLFTLRWHFCTFSPGNKWIPQGEHLFTGDSLSWPCLACVVLDVSFPSPCFPKKQWWNPKKQWRTIWSRCILFRNLNMTLNGCEHNENFCHATRPKVHAKRKIIGGTGVWTRDFLHAKQTLYLWAIPPRKRLTRFVNCFSQGISRTNFNTWTYPYVTGHWCYFALAEIFNSSW